MYIKPSPDPKESMWALIAFFLRFYRQQRGLTGEDLGKLIGCTKGQVSKLELGSDRLSEDEAKALDRAWNTGGLFALLVWYASTGHEPQWFAQYLHLEGQADLIRIFEDRAVPAILQTENYARCCIAAGLDNDKDEILESRMARQEILTRQAPPYVSVLLSQNALDWPAAPDEVMREQLDRLLELSEKPSIVIRAIPRSREAGAYPGMDGSFWLMAGEGFGEIAYAASPNGGRLVRAPAELRSYGIRYDRISAKALPEGPTRELIIRIRKEFGE